jgi:hypothetical protein
MTTWYVLRGGNVRSDPFDGFEAAKAHAREILTWRMEAYGCSDRCVATGEFRHRPGLISRCGNGDYYREAIAELDAMADTGEWAATAYRPQSRFMSSFLFLARDHPGSDVPPGWGVGEVAGLEDRDVRGGKRAVRIKTAPGLDGRMTVTDLATGEDESVFSERIIPPGK